MANLPALPRPSRAALPSRKRRNTSPTPGTADASTASTPRPRRELATHCVMKFMPSTPSATFG